MKTLYYSITRKNKDRVEEKIVNTLQCYCYRVVDGDKYYANENGIIAVLKKNIVCIILTDDSIITKQYIDSVLG